MSRRHGILNGRPCKHLRSKEMFYDNGTRRRSAAQRHFLVYPHAQLPGSGRRGRKQREDCGPERACYEE